MSVGVCLVSWLSHGRLLDKWDLAWCWYPQRTSLLRWFYLFLKDVGASDGKESACLSSTAAKNIQNSISFSDPSEYIFIPSTLWSKHEHYVQVGLFQIQKSDLLTCHSLNTLQFGIILFKLWCLESYMTIQLFHHYADLAEMGLFKRHSSSFPSCFP